ncbi:MAG: DUF1552 domain-containing protein, partial [Chloroflexota bacterium]
RQSILDTITSEITGLQSQLGSSERAKLDAHLTSIRALENKLTSAPTGGCSKPATPPADSALQFMNAMDTLAANLLHQQTILAAFACDITRIACLEYGNDQYLLVNQSGMPVNDEHGGYIHSEVTTNFPDLVKFEAYLATQFANLVTALATTPDPLDSTKMLLDNTLVLWARDMGDASAHDQKSMRFVLAGGTGGYLKTAAMSAADVGENPLFLMDYALRLLRVVVLLALWRTMLAGRETVGVMSLTMVLTYTVVAEVFGQQLALSTTLSEAFWEGTLVLRFLRPMGLVRQFAAEMSGRWVLHFALFSVPLVLLAPLLGVDARPASPAAGALFVVSLG